MMKFARLRMFVGIVVRGFVTATARRRRWFVLIMLGLMGWMENLRSRRGMAADFVTDDYGLKSIRCGVFHGLIFVNFCDDAPPLSDGLSALDSSFKIYDLANTKVAHREIFPVKANWKLAVENFMECYHCAPAHTEYAERHALQSVADNAKLRTQMRREAKAIGYETVTRSNVESPAWFGDEGKEKTAE